MSTAPSKMSKKYLLLLFLFFVACTERRQYSGIQESEAKVTSGQYQEASEILRKAIALNPESRAAMKAIYKLGYIQETYLKDFPAAVFSYEEFIRLSQDPVSLYEVQKKIAGVYFDHLKDSEKAIVAYQKALSTNPETLERDFISFRVAQSYFRQNKFEEARKEFQRLVERNPKSQYAAQARFEIGNTYYMEGEYDIAIEALKQVLRLDPHTEYGVEAQFLMAQCFEQQDKLALALQGYESIVGRYPWPDVLKLRIEAIKKRIKQKK